LKSKIRTAAGAKCPYRYALSIMLGAATRRRVLGLLAVGLLAAGAGLAIHATGLLNWLERDSVDARFSLRGAQHPSSDVVVVGIDNDSLGVLPRYPFSRQLDARVLENLHAAGARLVVYDISFDRPTTEGADQALFAAAHRSAPVVFGTSLISPSGETQVLGGNANLTSAGDQAAAADLLPDSDGVLRHTLAEVNGLPAIAAAVMRRLTGHSPNRSQMHGGWIDFPGPPGTVHSLSFAHVLNGHFDRAAVRGKVVVVGATAPVLQDLHSTAVGSPMSGPEVQADTISTALAGFPLRSSPGAVTVLLIVLLAFLVPLAGVRLGTLGACLAGLGILCLWSLATQLAFDSGAVLDYSDPLAALLLGTGGSVMLGMWADARERRRLRNLFAADAGGVVEQVLHRPGERPLEPTAIIAGYRLEEVLGRGGMGVVYRATQLALERAVAIKLIAVERSENPVFRERFAAESRIASSIEHANVIPVYEAGEDDGLLFIAMRLVEGLDLGQLLARLGPLPPQRTARVITQIAGALDAAHARGLVHRDVKPANILITADQPEHAYLTDFGLAKYTGALSRITKAEQWVGTLDYLAPEQIRGEPLDSRVDVYALTGVLYHCLIGETPFPRDSEAATMWAHVNASPPIPSGVRPELTEELDEVIARGMAKDPADRYASAGDMAQAAALALGLAPQLPASDPQLRATNESPQPVALTVLSEDR
jgi:CHASE2 domain-containing sensor protein/predicted Ser/Thr protein kinase